jgi:hypothetical protein
MGADDGAIEGMHVPSERAGGSGLRLHGVNQPLKDPGWPPAGEAAGPGAPGAIARRHVMPGGAGAEAPHHAMADAPIVDSWAACLRLLGGKQRLEPLPLCVGEVSSVHSTS